MSRLDQDRKSTECQVKLDKLLLEEEEISLQMYFRLRTACSLHYWKMLTRLLKGLELHTNLSPYEH